MSASTVDPAFEPLVRRLVADGFAESKLRRLFSRAELVFSGKAMDRAIQIVGGLDLVWPGRGRRGHEDRAPRWCDSRLGGRPGLVLGDGPADEPGQGLLARNGLAIRCGEQEVQDIDRALRSGRNFRVHALGGRWALARDPAL